MRLPLAHRQRIGLALVGFSLLALAGCGAQVLLVNDTNNETVHILGPNESLDPSNRLGPGESRIIDVEPGEDVTFRAGVNGLIFDVIGCDVPEPDDDFDIVLRVSYNGVLNCN